MRHCGTIVIALLIAGLCPAALPDAAPTNVYQVSAATTRPTEIDRLVHAKLGTLQLEPATACSDAVFVRRVYLDVIGTLPTEEEASGFLQDKTAGKRSVLIDQLLERPEFAEYWSMKWSDLLRVKSEFPINLWPNAVQAYHHWIKASITENKPYDRFARELLTSSGSNFRVPEANFYRAVQSREPAALAKAVALTFMGARAEKWPAEKLAGMAGFFTQVGYKATAEWKEEIVFFDSAKPPATAPVFPDGSKASRAPMQDPRRAFSDWLIRAENPCFTAPIANRVWFWLMGRGIVQEPDDFRADNPPWDAQLLEHLQGELVRSGFDLKHLYRLILNSQTYQQSSLAQAKPGQAAHAAENFACYPLRRLEAEVLIDAICQITGTHEKYSSPIPEPFTYVPEERRTTDLADGSISSSFLEMFGRSSRDNGQELERNSRISSPQRLHLLNSSHIQQKIEQGPALRRLTLNARTGQQTVSRIYLLILSRYPSADEQRRVKEYVRSAEGERQAAIDLIWALINSPEFLYRH